MRKRSRLWMPKTEEWKRQKKDDRDAARTRMEQERADLLAACVCQAACVCGEEPCPSHVHLPSGTGVRNAARSRPSAEYVHV